MGVLKGIRGKVRGKGTKCKLRNVSTKEQLSNGCIDHGCASRTPTGYGKAQSKTGFVMSAHKLAYCQSIGIDYNDLPKGKLVHTCANTRCINPAHLVFTEYRNIAEGSRLAK